MLSLLKSRRARRWLIGSIAALLLFVAAGVWFGFQFPSLLAGRKSSVELLADLFQAPIELTDDNARAALKTINKRAVVLFIRSCDLRDDVADRLVALVEGDRIDRVTLPFVMHLYELYGSPMTGDAMTWSSWRAMRRICPTFSRTLSVIFLRLRPKP